MLTKQEREEIAERIKSVGYVDEKTFYESIVGRCVPSTTSYTEDLKTIFRVVLDLCDTTNMIELPLDKDGVPFKRGDTVYESDGTEHIVDGYAFSRANAKIVSVVDLINNTRILFETDELTHKKPVTIESLVSEIRHTIIKSTVIDRETISKLWGIADQLENLSDSDE